MAKHILIVDDDALVRRSLAFNLEQAGYKTSNAEKAEDAISMVKIERPDLVLLDISLPGMDGLDALRVLKNELNLPVIFLTARRRELDEVLGLELGADDYVTKPFEFNVLLARIKNVFRHVATPSSAQEEEHQLTVGSITINPGAHTVSVDGEEIELTPREFDLLHAFALQPNKVLSIDELLASVWGAEFIGQPQVVYVHIRWLREKIEEDPNHPKRIVTVRGVGYKLVYEEE